MAEQTLGAPGPKPPEVVLPKESEDLIAARDAALALPDPVQRIAALGRVICAKPTYLDVWADLCEASNDPIAAYAYARVGYHRGLDALRQNGWRGNGFVRGEHVSNRGFLRCLTLLGRQATAIGESDEAQRCALFLRQLDPGAETVF